MRALGGTMKDKLMIQKRIPRFFHSDGNGIHLDVNRSYRVLKDSKVLKIKVVKEYQNYYLVKVNARYMSTVSKFTNDFYILQDWELEKLALFFMRKGGDNRKNIVG